MKALRIFQFFDVFLHPACWMQNHPLAPEWDAELTRLLDAGEPFRRETGLLGYAARYERIIGPYVVWVGNHPYASFTNNGYRPRRATILRAGRLLPYPLSHLWTPTLARASSSTREPADTKGQP